MQVFGADRHARDGRSDCCPKASISPLHPLSGQSIGGRLGVAADVGFALRYGEPVTVDDPWGYGNLLEWATSCPPPRHNFTDGFPISRRWRGWYR